VNISLEFKKGYGGYAEGDTLESVENIEGS
jgi:hypothetical protein